MVRCMNIHAKYGPTEILSHAWLSTDIPDNVYVPVPPPAELARPLHSAAHIDRGPRVSYIQWNQIIQSMEINQPRMKLVVSCA